MFNLEKYVNSLLKESILKEEAIFDKIVFYFKDNTNLYLFGIYLYEGCDPDYIQFIIKERKGEPYLNLNVILEKESSNNGDMVLKNRKLTNFNLEMKFILKGNKLPITKFNYFKKEPNTRINFIYGGPIKNKDDLINRVIYLLNRYCKLYFKWNKNIDIENVNFDMNFWLNKQKRKNDSFEQETTALVALLRDVENLYVDKQGGLYLR